MPIGEQFKRHFAGLIPIEARIWREWLKEHEGEFSEFTYNVLVGEGITPPARPITDDPEFDRKMREQYRRWTQKKIDVVGKRQSETWIFEIEERPGPRALGQLLMYETLLPRTFPVPGSVQLAIVGRRIGFDMLAVFEDQGFVVWRVDLVG